MKLLIALALQFFFSSLAYATRGACENLFLVEINSPVSRPTKPFPTWKLNDAGNLGNIVAEDFLPASFVERFKSGSDESLKTLMGVTERATGPDGRDEPGIFLSIYRENDSSVVVDLSLWAGASADAVRIDDLSLQNPLSIRKDLHQSQRRRGLPSDVFLVSRDRFLAFLRAGGYSTVEIESGENLSTHFLYYRFVGARPANPAAETMNLYLQTIVRLTRQQRLLGPKSSLNELSRHLGDVRGGRHVSQKLRELWNLHQDDASKLEAEGIETLRDGAGNIFAVRYQTQIEFVVPSIPGRPFLIWSEIKKNHAHYLNMKRDLER